MALPSDPMVDRPRRLFILDGHSLAYRAFFALPSTLATTTGQVTNAVYGFTSMLIKLLAEERPDLIAVAFDVGKPTARLAMDADYKAGRRETPEDFRPQLGLIQEVVDALRIRMLLVTDHEADDAIGTLAIRAAEQGIEATIVTADRDFFQLVRPGLRVLFNRRGISDIALMDEAAVEERYGIPPSKYLEYVALKGDTSDNIPGVPGVGDKTAAKLVQQFGSVEELLDRTGELKGKLKENIEAAGERLALNKNLARIVTDVDLAFAPDDAVMGEWDVEEVRRLFTSLEFRSLFDRLMELAKDVKPKVEVAELDLRRVEPEDLAGILADGPVGVAIQEEDDVLVGLAVSAGGAQAAYATLPGPGPVADRLADASTRKWAHDAKALERVTLRAGAVLEGVAFDTMLAGYLLEPGTADYPLAALCERYLGTDLFGGEGEAATETEMQLFAEEPWRHVASEAAAVSLLAPVLEEHIDRQGLRPLLEDVELPLASVLARMEARGVRLDVPYLEEMGESVRDRMATLHAEVFQHAGQEFNLNSPPQLRAILYDQLGLQPGKKTPKGELSTDASVLEKLRDAHPIVDALLSWRELDKLNSTYLEALPKLVDAKDGRLHTSFNQTVAATGRLSSSNPNLQNIPIRSELGRQIRRAFIPGADDQVLLVADYSQIELRILAHLSGDAGLREAFDSGLDIHAATAAKVFDLPPEHVDAEMRRRAKAVNYGLAYGMNAWGLATRLAITADEAQEFIDAYFDGFPAIKNYLQNQVDRATVEGFTETLLGRRRYIPELQAANPRVRDLGRRQALNAPIQGSASDVFKVGMIGVDRALRERPELDCHMLLTVHDELVFEVAKDRAEEAADLIRDRMEGAVELVVDLRADIGMGPNWSEAAPEGH
ncbi:MAG TPA: DNA polymerase I [Actinomycetota bacterium]|nr:DNA polymerase I [Actinomycetota bacterium]